MRSALSIQCIPLSTTDQDEVYRLVDDAIDVIEDSELDYTVSPFETTIEGELDEVWKVAKKAHSAILQAQEDEKKAISLIKVLSGDNIGTTSDKLAKYGDVAGGE